MKSKNNFKVTKEHILHDSNYMNVQNRHMYRDRKAISGCQGWGCGVEWGKEWGINSSMISL